ncbi:MAG: hypothetical protein ACXABY_22795, partial [Candidatus Thorarchaeota archaeon]
MAITTAANPGIEVTSWAKDSNTGSAADLGSQSGANADQVIVPNAIGTNNEGNLMASPSYVGRMFCLRPQSLIVSKLTGIAAGGSSYTASDVLTINSGGITQRVAATITVNTVDGGGAVTAATLTTIGEYDGDDITGTLRDQDAPVAVTGGTGTGATFWLEVTGGAEYRFILADSSNTLTVHEDWINPPVTSNTWAVSYIIQDVATVTGMTFSSKTNLYSASRTLYIGDTAATATAAGGLWLGDGVGLELDDTAATSEPGLNVEEASTLMIGYDFGGVPVAGAYVFPGNDTDGEWGIEAREGYCRWFDFQSRSTQADLSMQIQSTGITVSQARNYRMRGPNIIRDSKFFQTSDDTQLQNDMTFVGVRLVGTNTGGLLKVTPTSFWWEEDQEGPIGEQRREYRDIIFEVAGDGIQPAVSGWLIIRDMTFVYKDSAARAITMLAAQTRGLELVNPINLTETSAVIVHGGTTADRFIYRSTSFDITILDSAGAVIENALALIYSPDLDQEIEMVGADYSRSDGVVPTIYASVARYDNPGGTFTTDTFGSHIRRTQAYGKRPNIAALTLPGDAPTGVTERVVQRDCDGTSESNQT